MMQRTDTYAPTTQEPALGLREQLGEDLVTALPDVGEAIATAPKAGQHTLDFLRVLLLGKTPVEAVTLLTYALAPRHAIWWGHECLQAIPDLITDNDRQLMGLAAAWVGEPDEDNRYAALEAGTAAHPRGPGAWLAIAVGCQPAVPAAPHLLSRALNACVLTALARVPQDKRRRLLEHYVSIGEVLAKSG
jgi:hypothetical protein